MVDAAQQRALARTAGPKQRHHLSDPHRQIEPVEHGLRRHNSCAARVTSTTTLLRSTIAACFALSLLELARGGAGNRPALTEGCRQARASSPDRRGARAGSGETPCGVARSRSSARSTISWMTLTRRSAPDTSGRRRRRSRKNRMWKTQAGCFAASAPAPDDPLASDEFFKALTVSLPNAGIMVRIACGAMMRRISTRASCRAPVRPAPVRGRRRARRRAAFQR